MAGKGRRVEKQPRVEPKPEPLVVDVRTAAKRLGIGADRAYAAVAAGHIPTIPMGRRKVVPVAALDRLCRGEPFKAA